jgi:hypothetical protein
MSAKWQRWEVDMLIDQYGKQTVTAIAQKLDRTALAVTAKARWLGLPPPINYWTAAQVNYLLKHCHTHSAKQMARELGRSPSAVATMLSRKSWLKSKKKR